MYCSLYDLQQYKFPGLNLSDICVDDLDDLSVDDLLDELSVDDLYDISVVHDLL